MTRSRILSTVVACLLAAPLLLIATAIRSPAGASLVGASAPASPPVQICANASELNGPATAPAGSVTVPAGTDLSTFTHGAASANTTYYFATGTHTLGTTAYGQIGAATGDTFEGAPGAILSGQGEQDFSITGHAKDVTVEYLTITDYTAAVATQYNLNHTGAAHWTIEHDTVETTTAGGALDMGAYDTVQWNCLTHNAEYGFSGYSTTNNVTTVTFSDNEVSFNDGSRSGGGRYDQGPGTDTCGCAGGGKFWESANVAITDNYVHDNGSVGIWIDTDNRGFLISGNYISTNYGEGIMYEISYNALISDNTLVHNAAGSGAITSGFPVGAIYISESGGDSRVGGDYSGELTITGNVLNDNWGGVVVWENSNRYCGDGSDGQHCTLVTTSTYTLTNCKAHLKGSTATQTPDYYDNCRWKSKTVTVSDNAFVFTPAYVSTKCTEAAYCGFTGLFSNYGTTTPWDGWAVPLHISDDQSDHFEDNTYQGGWHFDGFVQGDAVTWTQWSKGFTDHNGSNDHFNAQDAGSTETTKVTTTAYPPPKILTYLAVTPASDALTVGGTQQYSAKAVYASGSVVNVTTQAAWSSSGSNVATVNASGRSSAVGGGRTTISASFAGMTGSVILTVLPTEPALSVVGSGTTYVVLHRLFPTTLDDLDPGASTANQVVPTTPAGCHGGLSYTSSAVPAGSAAGLSALVAEQSAASTRKSCITFARSASPPSPATASKSLDYYAFGLDGVTITTGANAGGSKSNPPALSLAELRTIYSCWTSKSSTLVDTWKQAGISTSTTVVNRFWPQTDSGPQTFYMDMLGFTPAKTHAQTAKVHCTTISTAKTKGPAVQRFSSEKTDPVPPNSEAGLLYANSLAQSSTTYRTLTNDLFIYAAGSYVTQWNTRTKFNSSAVNAITGTAIGNFVRTTTPAKGRVLRVGALKTTAGTVEAFVNYLPTDAAPHPTGLYALNPNVITESAEWFSHLPSNSSAVTASTAPYPGVTYLYDVADTALPNYEAAKFLIGFDNEKTGTAAALCRGDQSSVISGAGFLPLNSGRTAPANSDLAAAQCREFPGGSYPGLGGSKAQVTPTWTAQTTTK